MIFYYISIKLNRRLIFNIFEYFFFIGQKKTNTFKIKYLPATILELYKKILYFRTISNKNKIK